MKQKLKTKKGFSSILLVVISGIVVLGFIAVYFGVMQFRSYQAQQTEKEKQAQQLTSAQQKVLETNQKLIINQQKTLEESQKQTEILKKE